jgi:hypothetical protein
MGFCRFGMGQSDRKIVRLTPWWRLRCHRCSWIQDQQCPSWDGRDMESLKSLKLMELKVNVEN